VISSNKITQTKIIPSTKESCEIQSVVIVASFAVRVTRAVVAVIVAVVVAVAAVVGKAMLCTGAVINMLVEVLVIEMWAGVLAGVMVGVGVDMPTGEYIIVVAAAAIALGFAVPVLYAADVLPDVVVDVLTGVNATMLAAVVNVNILAAVVSVLGFAMPAPLGELSC